MINAKEYAKAMFLLSKEENKLPRFEEELSLLRELFTENPKYATLLDTPAVSESEKLSLIDEALSELDEHIVSFVKILASKRMTSLIPACVREFLTLCDEERGIENVEAITAIPMTEKQKNTLSEKLGRITGKTVRVKNVTDPSVLGGVRVRCKSIEIDGTFKTRLAELEGAIKKEIV